MPKRPTLIDESKIARDILNELELYGTDKQFQPVQNALYGHMKRGTKDREPYDYTIGEFNYWFDRLVRAGLIEVDPDTRAVRASKIVMVPRDT
jgi:hypothetical protein